jgi:hypothetical protein
MKNVLLLSTIAIHLSGVVVSVHAIGLKGRGFKPSQGDEFLRAIKVHSTPYFGWKVKPEDPCPTILWVVKRSVDITQILICKILTPSSIPPTCSQMSLLVGLPESSGGQVRSFIQPVSLSPWLAFSHIIQGMNNRLGGGRGSEMSHPINMINQAPKQKLVFKNTLNAELNVRLDYDNSC